MSGGILKNGAITAAFVQMFNHELHPASGSKSEDPYGEEAAQRRFQRAKEVSEGTDTPLTKAIAEVWLDEAGPEEAWAQIKMQKKYFYGRENELNVIEAEHYLYSYTETYYSEVPILTLAKFGYLTPGYQVAKMVQHSLSEYFGLPVTTSPPTTGQLYWGARGSVDALYIRSQKRMKVFKRSVMIVFASAIAVFIGIILSSVHQQAKLNTFCSDAVIGLPLSVVWEQALDKGFSTRHDDQRFRLMIKAQRALCVITHNSDGTVLSAEYIGD